MLLVGLWKKFAEKPANGLNNVSTNSVVWAFFHLHRLPRATCSLFNTHWHSNLIGKLVLILYYMKYIRKTT